MVLAMKLRIFAYICAYFAHIFALPPSAYPPRCLEGFSLCHLCPLKSSVAVGRMCVCGEEMGDSGPHRGPWKRDTKRFVTSVVLAGDELSPVHIAAIYLYACIASWAFLSLVYFIVAYDCHVF